MVWSTHSGWDQSASYKELVEAMGVISSRSNESSDFSLDTSVGS